VPSAWVDVQVVLAGASGLIGSALGDSLRADGHRVKTLVRREPAADDQDTWDPANGRLDPDFLADADAVVCLSGAPVDGRRWNEEYKKQILDSRVDSVATIARTLAEYGGPPVLVCASAVGYYGDTGDQTVDEAAPPGESFLSRVCVQWEAAAQPACDAGVRVTHLRTGLPLTGAGGLLKRLKPVVQAGVAGRLGSGRQFVPWISFVDEIAAIRFLIQHELPGPVNLTGPVPVRNAEFMSALGRVLHRPTVLPTPVFAIKIALGELAGEALAGQRAVPKRLIEAGFPFAHSNLESAMRAAFRR
jgi:uncharacterized protein